MKRVLLIILLMITFCSSKTFAICQSLNIICSPTECYTVVKELGEGSFGKVYAVENSIGQPFAIKTYKNALNTEDPFTDAQREYSRGQILNHPNIIKSHDLFMSNFDSELANIVLDLVTGKTLYNIERKEIGFPLVSETVGQFVDVLRYAFCMDFIYMDLHSGNIMLDNNSNIKIIDLASFFTLEEIQDFIFLKLNSSETTMDQKTKSTFSQATLSKAISPIQIPDEPSVLPLAPLKAAKLEKFFNEHSQLLKQIKEDFMKKEALASIKPIKMMAGKKSKKNSVIIDSTSIDLSPFLAYYFDRIIDICINLISKSDGNREEIIEMRVNLKKIAWNYEEDRLDGISKPFTIYLDQLFHSLQTS